MCMFVSSHFPHPPGPIASLYDDLTWSRLQSVQLTFRLLARNDFTPSGDMDHHIRRKLFRIGDTKIVEDTHNDLRDLFRDNKAPLYKTLALFERQQTGRVPEKRGLHSVRLDQGAFEVEPPAKLSSWNKVFRSSHRKCVPGSEVLELTM